MAKKQAVGKRPELEMDSADYDEAIVSTIEGGASYHATFIPTWRTEVDCGDHASLAAAQAAIVTAGEFWGAGAKRKSSFRVKWQQQSASEWTATGHDGQVETTMVIARIVRVAGA